MERFQELDGYALEARAREVLAGLSFSQERMDGDVGLLSGGWKMRVALARILLMRPDGMLLDEPSNHLDLESLIWLEAFLKSYDGALLMTSHDRAFMNRIIGKVVEIDAGSLITYSGDLDFYDQQRALERSSSARRSTSASRPMLAKEIKFIEQFKARASHAAQVQSRVKKLDKIERVEPPRRRQSVQFEFRSPPRSGDDVISLRNIHKGYGAQPIYEGLDFLVRRKERWCVLGANGAGKSTLLKLVAGATKPDQGAVNIGASVKMGYFAQHSMDLLDGEETIFESLDGVVPAGGPGRAAHPGGVLRLLRRRCRKALPRLVRRREGAPGHGQDAVRSAEPAGARRADQPPRHGDQGDAGRGPGGLRRHHALRLARPPFPGGPVEPRAGADARGSPSVRRRLYANMSPARARKRRGLHPGG